MAHFELVQVSILLLFQFSGFYFLASTHSKLVQDPNVSFSWPKAIHEE